MLVSKANNNPSVAESQPCEQLDHCVICGNIQLKPNRLFSVKAGNVTVQNPCSPPLIFYFATMSVRQGEDVMISFVPMLLFSWSPASHPAVT